MPIIVIGEEGGTEPKKTVHMADCAAETAGKALSKEFPQSVKTAQKKPALTPEAEEKILIREQKKSTYDIGINLKLAAFYRKNNNWPEAEHHEEIVEWLDRINRFVRSR